MNSYVICWLITAAMISLASAGPIFAQIKPYLKNPSYWQYGGQPILLFGGSDRDNIFQWAGDGTKLTDHLDLLYACGGNYIRCTMSSREYTVKGYRWNLLPYPFAKIDGKYDLREWDDVYWNNLRTFLRETKKRGIIVQLEIWDRWNESGNSYQRGSGWYDSPWNPNNNMTYNWSDSPLLQEGKTDFYNAIHMAATEKDPVLLPLQQKFVEKIVDEVIGGGYDHVLFQIDNESGIGDDSLEPDPYWARFIRSYVKSKATGFKAYVCTSRRFHSPTPCRVMNFQDWNNPEICVPIINAAFNYCDVSQNNGNSGQQQYDNLLWYRSKVLKYGVRPINHVKCYHFNWPTGFSFQDRTSPSDAEAGAKFWRVVFGGGASVRFHRHTPARPGGLHEGFGLTPEAQSHIRSLRMLVDAIHIFSMEPRNDLLFQRTSNEAYCLAEPGWQYAVFFTGDGDGRVEVKLTTLGRSFELRWLDIATSCWKKRATISARRVYMLTAPGSGHWVAVLIASKPRGE
jgi:hypothetical protein